MKSQKRSNTSWVLFFLYCTWMLILLFDREAATSGLSYREQLLSNMNLEPLHTIRLFVRVLLYDSSEYNIRLAIINLFGNIGMFIPLGFFLPLMWNPLRKWWRTWLTTLGVMTLVEIVQLFTLRGTCDVDDLILNVLGAALGYGLFCIIRKDRNDAVLLIFTFSGAAGRWPPGS